METLGIEIEKTQSKGDLEPQRLQWRQEGETMAEPELGQGVELPGDS